VHGDSCSGGVAAVLRPDTACCSSC
jgi:hypothetical protein